MKYLLFDLDGTLTESGEGIMNSAEYAFRAMGREVPDRAQLRSFVGPPLAESFPRFGIDKSETDEAIRQFRVYFTDKGWKEDKPYPGIEKLCRELYEKGYKLIVATSKLEAMAVRIIEYFGLKEYFLDVIGSIDKERASKADVINYAIKKYSIEINTDAWNTLTEDGAIMIGDRCYDVEGAGECGLKCVGVTYGYGTRAELTEAGAIAVVDTVEELGEFFA